MIPSKLYLEAFENARQLMVSLPADHPGFHRTVTVVHQDGSVFIFKHAFVAIDEKHYFVVIPEHFDVHIFYKDDLHDWSELVPDAYYVGKHPLPDHLKDPKVVLARGQRLLREREKRDASKRDSRKDSNR